MYTISEVSKLVNLTSRSLRHYEDKGLISAISRGENGYRYYDESSLKTLRRVKELKSLNFTLLEIKEILELKDEEIEDKLEIKLTSKFESIQLEIESLKASKKRIESQLLATSKLKHGVKLSQGQRRVFMQAIKDEILLRLKEKKSITKKDLEYLKREEYLVDSKEKQEFSVAMKNCFEFAKKENIKLGPLRGASPSLLSLYALGFNEVDPLEQGLMPERFSSTDFDIHMDVEFKNGKRFIDYCRKQTRNLSIGSIEAFKLPIIDIIENVHQRIGFEIDYDSIDDNDPMILDLFRDGDIEKIFSFDIPSKTLLSKYYDNKYYKKGLFTSMLSDYLKSQKVIDFKDVLNIEAIFRPENLEHNEFMRDYIDRYPKAKECRYNYDCLTARLNEYLEPNYGVIIYQEDISEIIKEYTNWNYQKCNEYRKELGQKTISQSKLDELESYTGKEVLKLLIKETPLSFCKSHSHGSWVKIIKKTAVLKAKYKEIYFSEIEKWESLNDFSWGDFGFISGEVSLLQQ